LSLHLLFACAASCTAVSTSLCCLCLYIWGFSACDPGTPRGIRWAAMGREYANLKVTCYKIKLPSFSYECERNSYSFVVCNCRQPYSHTLSVYNISIRSKNLFFPVNPRNCSGNCKITSWSYTCNDPFLPCCGSTRFKGDVGIVTVSACILEHIVNVC